MTRHTVITLIGHGIIIKNVEVLTNIFVFGQKKGNLTQYSGILYNVYIENTLKNNLKEYIFLQESS